MQHSDKPQQELAIARDLVEKMKRARSLAELEELWKPYLRHLDRTWNKAEAHFSRSPKWSGWQGKYLKERSKDPLICYLVQARNIEEHSIDEITEKRDGFLGVDPAGPGQILRFSLQTGANGEIVNFKANTPARITFSPSHVALLPVSNRGRVYQPPTSHLGDPINPNDIIAIATIGIQFYSGFLFAAESFFVDSSSV